MDHFISDSELCYKGTVLQRNCRKMTILWSFSYNSFVKFHDKQTLETKLLIYIPISVVKGVLYGTTLYV